MAWTYLNVSVYVWLVCWPQTILFHAASGQAQSGTISPSGDNKTVSKQSQMNDAEKESVPLLVETVSSVSVIEENVGVNDASIVQVTLGDLNEDKIAEALAWIEWFSSSLEKTKSAVDQLTSMAESNGTPLFGTIFAMMSQTLSVVSQGLGLAGGIINFIISFFLPSEMDIIREDIKRISNQLDQLTDAIKDATKQVKTSVEFNNWLTTYIVWELAIRNGDDRLVALMDQVRETTDIPERHRLARQYVKYFEENKIEDAVKNIHRLAGQKSTMTTRNLFELYCKEKGYYPKDLGKLMLVISDLVISASKQIITYYSLRFGVKEAEEAYMRTYALLEDIRVQYEWNLWYILRDVKTHAMEEVKSVVDDFPYSDEGDELGKDIAERLSSVYGWYDWAIVVTDDRGVYTTGTYESKGSNYFYLSNYGNENKRNILVAWQDINQKPKSCTDIMDGSSVVFFAGTEGKSTYAIASTGDVMTSTTCWPSKQQVQDYYLKSQATYNMPQWIATAQYERNTDCSKSQACNGHGQCYLIPYSPAKTCICESHYGGDNCEHYTNFEADRIMIAMLAALRLSYGNFTRVTSAVDIHYAVKDLDEKIDDGHEKIMDVLEYLKSLINNGEVLSKAQYIKSRYGELLANTISDDEFGEYMEAFLRMESIDYILVELQNTLLGVGLFDNTNGDILTAYKKSYIAYKEDGVACTKEYAADIFKMIQKLAGLDETVCESMLWFIKWKLQQSSESDQEDLVNYANSYLSDAKTRHDAYTKTWRRESCPDLIIPDLVQGHCSDMLSYEGLSVRLTCLDKKVAIPDYVECIRNETTLNWTSIPSCEYIWGSWGDWTSCSKSCDGGQQTRTRKKLNNDSQDERRLCNEQDCCQKMYNKRRCGSGECIQLKQDCDGVMDCVDNSDENQCTYLKSGDSVSLKSACDGYVDCHCTHTGCGWWTGKKTSCLASGADQQSRFTLYNDRGVGTAILHGDSVALRYRIDGDQGYWLSCPGQDGKECRVLECPGLAISAGEFSSCDQEVFKMFSQPRRGECETYILDCLGKPIYPRDVVYLRHSVGHWLSGSSGNSIRTLSCPGQYLDSADSKCSCEMWTIFKK